MDASDLVAVLLQDGSEGESDFLFIERKNMDHHQKWYSAIQKEGPTPQMF